MNEFCGRLYNSRLPYLVSFLPLKDFNKKTNSHHENINYEKKL